MSLIVGHLPFETSQFTKFLIDLGAIITETLSKTHFRKSPTAQRNLEIPCIVKAEIFEAQKNKEVLRKYLEMVHALYIEPSLDKEIIVDFFLTGTHSDEESFMVGNIPDKK